MSSAGKVVVAILLLLAIAIGWILILDHLEIVDLIESDEAFLPLVSSITMLMTVALVVSISQRKKS